MALSLDEKKAVVEQVSDLAGNALSVVAAEYRGLSVEDMSGLRAGARDANVVVRVVNNSLAKRALADSNFSALSDILTGPLVLGFSMEDLGGAARVFRDFSRDNDKLKVTGITIGEELMDASHLEAVASLPTYDQAIAILMAVMKAPVEKFVRATSETYAKLVRTVDAVRAVKES